MRSLQSFQTTDTAKPKQPAAIPKKVTIRERMKVVVTQGILYRTHSGQLIRPGHKMIPPGSVGVVKTITDDGYQVEFQTPVIGVMQVNAPEIKVWEKSA